jgi:hypothetical protein
MFQHRLEAAVVGPDLVTGRERAPAAATAAITDLAIRAVVGDH